MTGKLLINVRHRKVIRDGVAVFLTGIQFRLFCALYYNGAMHVKDLIDAVYGWDAGGGPLASTSCLAVHTHHANAHLQALDAKIFTPVWGYRALQVED